MSLQLPHIFGPTVLINVIAAFAHVCLLAVMAVILFFLIMLGGEVTCIESMEGAEVFGEKIQHILKLSVLKQNIMSQPFDHQVYKYKLATVPTFSWPGYLQ